MNNKILIMLTRTLVLSFFIFFIISCNDKNEVSQNKKRIFENKKSFIAALHTHLDAVGNKDLISLKSTLSPTGKMSLILPNSEIIKNTDEFIKFHEEWFTDTTWTFETKILSTEIGEKIGIAITEILYKEPNRNGKPYFNRMIVSYGLEKIDNKWYVIKDHASSVEKSE